MATTRRRFLKGTLTAAATALLPAAPRLPAKADQQTVMVIVEATDRSVEALEQHAAAAAAWGDYYIDGADESWGLWDGDRPAGMNADIDAMASVLEQMANSARAVMDQWALDLLEQGATI